MKRRRTEDPMAVKIWKRKKKKDKRYTVNSEKEVYITQLGAVRANT